MPACIHQHVDTQTYTQTPYGVCVKSLWDTLYIDTHTICLDPTYTNGERLYFQTVKTGIHVKRNLSLPPRGFYFTYERLPSQRRGNCCTPRLLDLLSEGDWKGEGEGKRKNCQFLALSPPNPPLLLPGVSPPPPLSLSLNPGGKTSRHPTEGIKERETLRLISSFNTMIVLTIFKL